MKKSLLALAVLGAFAGAANAQTNVTIYGVVDAGIARETGGANGSAWKLNTGMQSGNRLGFKGTEDLGGGLKANFQLESGFAVDTGALNQQSAVPGTTTLFGRQAFVGLSGNFGAVNLGRQYDPLFIALDTIDPFDTGLSGNAGTLMLPGTRLFGNAEAPRVNNALSYTSPNVSGFSATALYGLGETAGDNSKGRTYALSANYANGPLVAVFAYSNTNDALAGAAPVNSAKAWLIGGTYDFGVAKAHFGYESEKSDANSALGQNDYRDLMVGVSAPVGGGTVLASFIKKTDKLANSNAGAKQYAVGYTYPLSKRTNLYTSYGRVTNDTGAAFSVTDASNAVDTPANGGQSSSQFAVGVRHTF